MAPRNGAEGADSCLGVARFELLPGTAALVEAQRCQLTQVA